MFVPVWCVSMLLQQALWLKFDVSFDSEDYFVTFGAHDRETEIDGQPETYSVVNITVVSDVIIMHIIT